ncbi:hypothetical protein SPRG_14809 [Saprolegnia parasitica CBS 223.65]|uniref:Uncharacterized protein n=1 Tax=Saprolegnia parasitica (strain CBS 223.65) TaxID=695850 RepID=A0A067BWH9_SAPPC|nr:hypothetical protein SPRG_14809 [Saprolegnia parasitica CBS 223.65]KDO18972.1 hypothetical protein SPRG_14809 [Saprolegnia parasitica CBS 223.65]|eukprot:XP_012210320.1 hypothetical protein SPRG_14809 [Saprolegnia parasitica CBS 223.65]
MGDTSRGRRAPNARPARGNGYGNQSAIAGTGIKSGMTVEDLKRLTQKRMQEATVGIAPVIPAEVITPKAKPTIAVPVVPPPFVPKTGMTVQELKQLTTLRLAQQSVGTPTHQAQAAANEYKPPMNQYYARNVTAGSTPTSSPGGTPKRQTNRSSFTSDIPTPKQVNNRAPPVAAPRNGQAKRMPDSMMYVNGGGSPNQQHHHHQAAYASAPAPQYEKVQ